MIQASLLVALSGVLYGFLGFFGTMVLQENISMMTMLIWRFTIAGVWILLFSWRKCSLQKISAIDKRLLLYLFVLSAIGYTGSSLFYFMASQFTGTGLAMVIFFTYPMLVAFCSWFFYQTRINTMTCLALLAIFSGLCLLQYAPHQDVQWVGVLFGMLSASCYTFYLMGSKTRHLHELNSSLATIVVCSSSAMVFVILALVTDSFILPKRLQSWIYLLGLGIFATAMPIQLMLKGLKTITPMRASMISVLEPIVTLFVGFLCLNEPISLIQGIGTVIILSSTLFLQFQRDL